MSEEALELKPCPSPSCGGDDGPRYRYREKVDGRVWVGCGCGVRGPECSSRDEAQRLWNELHRGPSWEEGALRQILE